MDDSITLKGIRQGVLITVKPEGRWPEMSGRLMKLIDEQGGFFVGAQVTLSLGEREVRRHELASTQKSLAKRDVTLLAVLSDSASTLGSARKLGLVTDLADLEARGEDRDEGTDAAFALRPPPIDPEERGTTGVLVKRTVRNGRLVQSDGHVVVLGDVNAGAMIVAGGDVIVWGKLRGTVHAGADGDEAAVVCALYLAPTQLRIAGYITISPDEKRRNVKPEKAMVRNGRIEAVAWEL